MSELSFSHGLYPYNPSLAEDVKRLLFSIPIGGLNLGNNKNRNDTKTEFSLNGVDSEVFPDRNDHLEEDLRLKALCGGGYSRRSDKTSGYGSSNNSSRSNSRNNSGNAKQKGECVFCRNNGETRDYYQGHLLKDRNGKVTCPVLHKYICPICGATADNAHTIKYCPKNKHRADYPGVLLLKSMRRSTGKRDLRK